MPIFKKYGKFSAVLQKGNNLDLWCELELRIPIKDDKASLFYLLKNIF